MKLTIVKNVEVEDALIEISFWLEQDGTSMTLEYTCPQCAGHGCRTHYTESDCQGGTVRKKLDPASLDKFFDAGQLLRIKSTIQNLFLTITGD